MILAYCDETDSVQMRYSAFTLLIFPSTSIAGYRRFVVSELRKVFEKADNDATPFPTLHSVSLPEQLSDEKKVRVFQLFSEAISKYCIGICRVGYSWDNEVVKSHVATTGMSVQNSARLHSLSTVQLSAIGRFKSPIQYIWELDRENIDGFSHMYNMSTHIEHDLQLEEIRGEAYSGMNKMVVGAFFCEKRDHVMYGVDFCSRQLAIRNEPNPTAFKADCAESSTNYENLVFRNQIVS